MDRERFLERVRICRSCENFGDHKRDGECVRGCGLLKKPCRVEIRWRRADTNWCPLNQQTEEHSTNK